MKTSRRRIMAGALAGGASTVFLPARLGQLLAAEKAPPRLLIIHMPNASVRSKWLPTGGLRIGGGGDASSFKFGELNRALEPLRSHVTMLVGLRTWNTGVDAHSSPLISTMTGQKVGPTPPGASRFVAFGTAPSIDQLLAARSTVLKGTPFASLQLSCDSRTDRNEPQGRSMSYGLDTKPIVPDNSPHQVYSRLFGREVSGGAVDPQTLEAARKRERSVLDFMLADLARLRGRVPAGERVKLDGHLEGIRELERTLNRPVAMRDVGSDLKPDELLQLKPDSSPHHAGIVSSFFKIIQTAFRLDLTRVVTLAFGGATSKVSFSGLVPGSPSLGVHTMSHMGEEFPKLAGIATWYVQQVAALGRMLLDTPDASGAKLLDNTLVVFFSETGQQHEHDNVPAFLLGGSALGHRGGRALIYSGRYLHDLWPAVATAFGVPMPIFGDPSTAKGPLEQALA